MNLERFKCVSARGVRGNRTQSGATQLLTNAVELGIRRLHLLDVGKLGIGLQHYFVVIGPVTFQARSFARAQRVGRLERLLLAGERLVDEGGRRDGVSVIAGAVGEERSVLGVLRVEFRDDAVEQGDDWPDLFAFGPPSKTRSSVRL